MVPRLNPVTTPDEEPIVETEVLLLLHVPPPLLVNSIVAVTHTDVGPVIADGSGFTVMVVTAAQPDAGIYVIVAVPAETPVAIPEPDPIVAMLVALLLHVPPLIGLLSVVLPPMHIWVVPVIAGDGGVTVITPVTAQPVPVILYVIVVVPAVTPVTIPVDEPIVAIPVLLLLQVPPVVALLIVTVPPIHTALPPVIAAGNGLTVTVLVVAHPVGNNV